LLRSIQWRRVAHPDCRLERVVFVVRNEARQVFEAVIDEQDPT
jgi:hypothetical protein